MREAADLPAHSAYFARLRRINDHNRGRDLPCGIKMDKIRILRDLEY